MPTPHRRSARPPRTSRSWVWTAVTASISAMVLAFIAITALELTHVASTSAPLLVVADSGGPTSTKKVPLSPDQLTRGVQPSVTVRLRNDSTSPVRVSVRLDGGEDGTSGTLTAALTAQGAVVRSGPLAGLALDSFNLDALSTTPLTLELDASVDDLDEHWPTTGKLELVVTAQP